MGILADALTQFKGAIGALALERPTSIASELEPDNLAGLTFRKGERVTDPVTKLEGIVLGAKFSVVRVPGSGGPEPGVGSGQAG